MATNEPKVWLITGCSAGFGKEVALAALKRGDKVIATARNADKLAELRDAGAHALALDVTSPLPELQALADEAIKVYGQVDILVNNAGYLLAGAVEETTPEQTLAQFDTNVLGLLNVTRVFLPHMRERKTGVIALIGSVGGWVSYPGCGIYCSTKFTLEGLAEALHAELAPLGIAVTVLELGYFRTSLLNQGSNFVVGNTTIPDYEPTAGAVLKMLREYDGKQPGDPVKAAQRTVDVLTLSGSAEGRKEIPVRLALGRDALELIKKKMEASLALLEEWKDLSIGTEHDDVVKHDH
ncbi:putative Short-chain oxidoreductase [Balamuthia mandrillaris]